MLVTCSAASEKVHPGGAREEIQLMFQLYVRPFYLNLPYKRQLPLRTSAQPQLSQRACWGSPWPKMQGWLGTRIHESVSITMASQLILILTERTLKGKPQTFHHNKTTEGSTLWLVSLGSNSTCIMWGRWLDLWSIVEGAVLLIYPSVIQGLLTLGVWLGKFDDDSIFWKTKYCT